MFNPFKKNPPLDPAQILTALARVAHPERGRDIVQLKMVQDLAVNGGKISFTILLDEVGALIRAPLERQIRSSLQSVAGIREIKINWQARVAPRAQSLDKIENLEAKYILAVASGKGGVGKSTVAVNLACALARGGARVGLLDADVHGPNIPLMMGINEQPMAMGERVIPLIAHGVKLMSMGFLVPVETPVIWRGPMLSQAVRQFLTDVVWGELDYLIVDLPPGTGDAQLALVQSISLSGVVLVTTPQAVALADVIKGLEMFRQMEVPILGVIENMSYFICDECGKRHEIFSTGGGKRLSEKLQMHFFGEIPLDEHARAGGDAGKPVVLANADAPAGKAFAEIAARVKARVDQLPPLAKPKPRIKSDPALRIVN